MVCHSTPDGGFAVCGEYDEYDAFVMRTDASGDSLWTRVFDLSGAQRAFRVIYWDNALTVFQWAGMGPRNCDTAWTEIFSGTSTGLVLSRYRADTGEGTCALHPTGATCSVQGINH